MDVFGQPIAHPDQTPVYVFNHIVVDPEGIIVASSAWVSTLAALRYGNAMVGEIVVNFNAVLVFMSTFDRKPAPNIKQVVVDTNTDMSTTLLR
jgi:hypothetical protein